MQAEAERKRSTAMQQALRGAGRMRLPRTDFPLLQACSGNFLPCIMQCSCMSHAGCVAWWALFTHAGKFALVSLCPELRGLPQLHKLSCMLACPCSMQKDYLNTCVQACSYGIQKTC